MSSERVYRQVEPSDLPNIQSGKLKAFYVTRNLAKTDASPAKLVSTRFGEFKTVMWIVENRDYDRYATGFGSMMIDITPEKRYAIWDKKKQRFISYELFGVQTTKEACEAYLDDVMRKYGLRPNHLTIVEFDYPGE